MSEKKYVEEITSMNEDFAKWYTDIVIKADLLDYSSVRGCMIIRPYGYAIWELIQKKLDHMFKQTGHENIYMPMFIPESLLEKEKDHVEGFSPEVAWVTHAGEEQLSERLCVRPTSETLFCEHYAKIIHSHRDLPKLYNQWCSVVRWEKTTRPFLRSVEFLWQEGHTAHATAEEAVEETVKILNLYAEFCEKTLSIPIIKGKKTDKEKFAGAQETYTIESLMHDGKILQSGTSHNFGDGFAKAFGIQYQDINNELKYVYQTSWGVTTRLIGALIMVHSDNNGLVLPPEIAPVQMVIVPISNSNNKVMEKANDIYNRMSKTVRVKMDDSNKKPGWKFSEYEMRGVPVRLEIGPKDIEQNQVVLVRRDTHEKLIIANEQLEVIVPEILEKVQKNLFDKAKDLRDNKTHTVHSFNQFREVLSETPGFIKAMWCGEQACEDKIKELTTATARCIPFEQEQIDTQCVYCGKEAKHLVFWGKAY